MLTYASQFISERLQNLSLIGIDGSVQLQTSFSPDLGLVEQKIEFFDEIDQSYMPDLISSLRQVLDEYPLDIDSLAIAVRMK